MALAELTVEQAGRWFREKWRKAFGEYDVEKVFWQSVYGEGIAGVSWLTFQIYKSFQVVTKADKINAVLSKYGMPTFALGVSEALKFWANPVGYTIITFVNAIGARERYEGWSEEMKAEFQRELYEAIGIPSIAFDIFDKHFGTILVAIPALFGFLEYRRVKRLKEVEEYEG